MLSKIERMSKDELISFALSFSNGINNVKDFINANWNLNPNYCKAVVESAYAIVNRVENNINILEQNNLMYNDNNALILPIVRFFDDGLNVYEVYGKKMSELEREYYSKLEDAKELRKLENDYEAVKRFSSENGNHITPLINHTKLNNLYKHNGKKVVAKIYDFGNREFQQGEFFISGKFGDEVLTLGNKGGRFIYESGDGVVSINDAETGTKIFENPYLEQDFSYLQKVWFLYGDEIVNERYADMKKYLVVEKDNYYKDSKKRQKNAMQNVSEWYVKGLKCVYKAKSEEWLRCVKTRAGDLYNGTELDNALEIMEALNKGASIEEASKLIAKNHSGMSYSMMLSIITTFSKRGPDFHRYIVGKDGPISEQREKYLKEIEKANKQYEKQEHKECEMTYEI